MKKIAAIILAAGEGKRMKAQDQNKVAMKLANKQMIVHTVDLLDKLNIEQKIAVVGFAKESVISALGDRVEYAIQEQRLGSAHAAEMGIAKLGGDIETVLVLNGDDSAFFTRETIENLIEIHHKEKAAMSFLTIMVENPVGLGRIIRDDDNKVIGIVEERDATEIQRKIKEINPACYIFEVNFLREYLKKVEKSPISGEYYLVSLVDIAINNQQKIEAVPGGKILWRGVNTPEELQEAEKLFLNK